MSNKPGQHDLKLTAFSSAAATAAGQIAPERLAFLGNERKSGGDSRRYTRFVRSMRLLLPLVALGIVWLVISWPNLKNRLEPVKAQLALPENVGQNELLRPRYQSMDNKEQSYNITAHRAIQSSHDPKGLG